MSGLASITEGARPRWWTPARLWRLAGLLEDGATDEQIARALGTSVDGVLYARKKYGLKPASRQHLTARQIGRMLGFANGHPVGRWIEHGWLRAHKVRRAQFGTWQVRRSDLLAFLENPAYWHRWDPAAVTDPGLARYVARVRGDIEVLGLGEVAARCYVEPGTVWTWIDAGLLPARWDGWRWWVRADDLEGFTPPNQRSRKRALEGERPA